MRRITFWFLSTLSAVVLLFGYHTSTSAQLTAGSAYSVSRASTQTPVSGSTGSGSSGTGTGTRSDAPASSPTTVTGSIAQTQWGPVQVQLSVTSGKITDVSVLQYPSGNPRDEEINSYALPILVQETLDAQNTQIDMVSGATVTSGGYLQSLQSAVDQANL